MSEEKKIKKKKIYLTIPAKQRFMLRDCYPPQEQQQQQF
jgi:hypothetical protein